VQWSGVAAVGGAVLWTLPPWLQLATIGTRPYVATPFDVGTLVGWLLMLAGLGGARACYGDRLGRIGRVGLGLSAVGMVLVAGLYLRRVVVFAGSGFRPVPATGEDPTGLVLTWAVLLGFGLTLAGAGLLGVGLWRLDRRGSLAGGLLVAAPLFVVLVVGLGVGSLLPLPIGRAVVRTNLGVVPFAIGWMALGRSVYTRSRDVG
jgi:hypothetical protein